MRVCSNSHPHAHIHLNIHNQQCAFDCVCLHIHFSVFPIDFRTDTTLSLKRHLTYCHPFYYIPVFLNSSLCGPPIMFKISPYIKPLIQIIRVPRRQTYRVVYSQTPCSSYPALAIENHDANVMFITATVPLSLVGNMIMM